MTKTVIIRYDMKNLFNKFKEEHFYNIEIVKDKISHFGIEGKKFIDSNDGALIAAKYLGKSNVDDKLIFIIDIISIKRDAKIEEILK